MGDIIVVIDDGSGPAEASAPTATQQRHLPAAPAASSAFNSNYLTSVEGIAKVKS